MPTMHICCHIMSVPLMIQWNLNNEFTAHPGGWLTWVVDLALEQLTHQFT